VVNPVEGTHIMRCVIEFPASVETASRDEAMVVGSRC
jgi:hypothetical protein